MTYATNRAPTDEGSEYARLRFVVQSLLAGVRTAIPVQVMAVTNAGGVSPIGTVSIQPLVNAIDASGQATAHGTVYNCPYLRIQGGTNAVILDPQVGDIGLAVICDRDISATQAGNAAAPPGSNRRFDLSDAVYLSSIMGSTIPTQYIEFNTAGITIHSPGAVSITAGGAVSVTAPTITLGSSGETLQSLLTTAAASLFNGHTHTSSSPGSPTSAPNQTMGAAQQTTVVTAG